MLLSLPLCNNFGISFFYFFSLLSLTCYKKENESRCVQRCNKMVFPEHLILGRRESVLSHLWAFHFCLFLIILGLVIPSIFRYMWSLKDGYYPIRCFFKSADQPSQVKITIELATALLKNGSKLGFILSMTQAMVWLQTNLSNAALCLCLLDFVHAVFWSNTEGSTSVWCLEELGFQEVDLYIVPGEEFCQNSFMAYVLICIWGFFVLLLIMVNFVAKFKYILCGVASLFYGPLYSSWFFSNCVIVVNDFHKEKICTVI